MGDNNQFELEKAKTFENLWNKSVEVDQKISEKTWKNKCHSCKAQEQKSSVKKTPNDLKSQQSLIIMGQRGH